MSVRASLAYFLSRGLSGGLAVATVSLFARQLGPQGYASLTLAIPISAFVGSVLIMPLHNSLGRFLPGRVESGLTPTLGRLLLLGSALGLILAWFIESLGLTWLGHGVVFAAVILCLAQGFFDFSAQWASSNLMARRYGRLYLLKALLAPAVGLSLVALGFGFWGAVMGMSFAYLASVLIALPQPWLEVWRGRFAPSDLREVFGYMRGIALVMLLGAILSWSDRLLMARFSVSGLGAYGAAADLTQQGFGLIFSALFLAWFPRLVAAWEKEREAYPAKMRRYLQLSAAVMPPVAAGFALVCGDLVQVLLGAAYQQDAPRLMPWLALAALLGGVRMYVTDVALHLRQRLDLQCWIVGACGVLGLGLNFWLLPRVGVIGAAWSAVAANGLGVVLGLLLAKRMGGLVWPWRDLLISCVGVALMALALHFVPEGSLLRLSLRVTLGVAVYGAVALVGDLAGGRSWLWAKLRARVRSGAC